MSRIQFESLHRHQLVLDTRTGARYRVHAGFDGYTVTLLDDQNAGNHVTYRSVGRYLTTE